MEKDNLVHDFSGSEEKNTSKKSLPGPIILFLILAVLGVGTGYLLSQTKGSGLVGSPTSETSKDSGEGKGKIYGSEDTKTFNNDATGVLREGGIDGEGAYHLERPGGESQNVYLISSVLDLSLFLGKKVKVWGQTHDAEKAGWLMDVGRLQVL